MLFHSGKTWVVDFLLRRGWLVRRRIAPRQRPGAWHPLSNVPAERLEQRTLLSTITVTTLNDEATTNAQVSLREAIAAANTDTSVDGSVAGDGGVTNTIVFAPGLTGTISLDAALGEMTISSSMIIQGLGASQTLIDAQQNSRIFDITGAAGNVTFGEMTLENGKTTAAGRSSTGGAGGAIFSASAGTLSLSGDVLSGNSTTGILASGGAIFADGPVTIVSSTLSGNLTSGPNAAYGGAIYSAAAVTLLASTLSGNSTSGIHSYGGALFSFGNVQLTNSTVTGNSTTGAGSNAGAIWAGAALTATNSTIAQNTAVNGQGGGFYQWIFDPNPTITLKNTIVAQNTDNGTAPDLEIIGGATVTVTHSLIGNNAGTGLTEAPVGSPDGNGNLIGGPTHGLINPELGVLVNNGGPTQTMALQAGSPAIEAGSNPLAVDPNSNAPLMYDQRGAPFLRIIGNAVDMGAYEYRPTVVTSTAPLPADASSVTISGTGFDATAANNSVVVKDTNTGTSITVTPVTASTTSLTVPLAGIGTLTAGDVLTAVVTCDGVDSGTGVQVATVAPVVTPNLSNALLPGSTSLTIGGSGFDPTKANDSVTLKDGNGNIIGNTVSSASATSLTLTLTGPLTGGTLYAAVSTNSVSSGTAVKVATVAPVVTPNLSNALLPGSTSLTIGGSGFDPTKANDSVTLKDGNGNVISNTISSASATSLTLTLTGPLTGGTLYAAVTTNSVSSGTAVEVAKVTPVVTGSTANLAANATTIQIAGSGFDPVAAHNRIVFNDGAVGTVSVASATSLTVTFSARPVQSGSLTSVVVTNGVSSGADVQVATLTPVVTGSTASLAFNATTVHIAGFGFSPVADHNTIVFNDGAIGTVTAATATSLTVTFSTKPIHLGNLTALVTTNSLSSGTAVQVATVGPVVTSSTSSLAANPPTITIHGFGFDTIARHNAVVFNDGAVGTVVAATKTVLTVRFTTRPTTAGSLTAIVTTNGWSSGAAVQVGTVTPFVATSAANLLHTATTITINGFGFDLTPGHNTVYFSNGAVGIVTVASATSLTITFTRRPTTLGKLTAHVVIDGIDSGVAVRVATVS